jgi:hypothetical protein
MWQTARLSNCRQLNGVSFNTELHDVLYRTIYSLLISFSVGTLQGF